MQQRPLIDENLPLRRGAIAVILRGERFLVIRRSATVAAPRMFCFPGGGIEGDETETAAICRELIEELSLPVTPIRRVWRNLTRWNIDLYWWLAEIEESAETTPNPAEVESIHWMTVGEMLALDQLLESNRDFLSALSSGEIDLSPGPSSAATDLR